MDASLPQRSPASRRSSAHRVTAFIPLTSYARRTGDARRSPTRRSCRGCLALGVAALLTIGCAGNPQPLQFTANTTAGQVDPRDRTPYRNLAEALEAGALSGTRADWKRIRSAWQRSPDLIERLAELSVDPVEDTTLDAARTRARLDSWAGDLAARRALAEEDPGQARLVEALVAAIDATGAGTSAAPWQVDTAHDAVALLEHRGLEVVGGYYGIPDAHRLTLVLKARRAPGAGPKESGRDVPLTAALGDAGIAREFAFDLSTMLAAWREARAWRGNATGSINRSPGRELVDALAAAGDGFALTSRGLLIATETGPGGRYDAADHLQRAARAGNAVAHYTLGDLYLQLADGAARTGGSVPEAARASARGHYLAAVELGAAYGHYKLGLLALQDGERALARSHLERAHAGGDRDATRELAALLRETGDNDGRALALLAALAEDGDVEGGHALALWQLEDRRVSDPLALQALEANALRGYARSTALLGDLHARGLHVERDHRRARELWRRAAMSSSEPMLVEGVARALLLNQTATLHDPQAAAEVLDRVLRYRSAQDCGRCFATLARARLALGDITAARSAYTLGLQAARRSRDAEALGALRQVGLELGLEAAPAVKADAQEVAQEVAQL